MGRDIAAQARILDLRLECLAYVCVRVCVRVCVCVCVCARVYVCVCVVVACVGRLCYGR